MRRLTLRERQVSRLTKLGWKRGEIAERLGLAKRTVTNLREKVKRKRGYDWFVKESA